MSKEEPDRAGAGETAWLQLHAEDVQIGKRKRAGQTVRLSTHTRTRDAVVDEALVHEGVVVERVPVGRYVEAVPPVRQEGDTTIVPVVEEEVVITRRLLLREEVHLRRTRTVRRHTETVSLREQTAHVTRIQAEPEGAGPVAFIEAGGPRSQELRRDIMDEETIVAVYDTPAAADAAVADLRAAKVPESAISRHSGTTGMAGAARTTSEPVQEKGFWSSLFGGDTGYENDATVYDRSLQGGSSVVTVKSTPGHDVEAVAAILERHSPIDIDERAAGYGLSTDQSTGQTLGMGAAAPRPGPGVGMAAQTGAAENMAMRTQTAGVGTGAPRATAPGAAVSDAGTMQLSEEQINVGKRLVNRGGTRIRRYVVERPVEENVSLHSERVTLERRPVTDGRPVGDGSFSEKTIEMSETAEEVVISKTSRVVEEVGLRKEATDRVETVRDSVRKEEVEVEQMPSGTPGTASAGAKAPKV